MPAARPRAHVMMADDAYATLFDEARLTRLHALADTAGRAHIGDALDPAHRHLLADVEVLITSWGAPQFDADLLSRMPRLRAVLHAAGSVRAHVSPAFWERDILITSAADVNAVPVAEFTLATILLAGKRALVHLRDPSGDLPGARPSSGSPIGNVDRTIGIVGFSRIGRRVVKLLSGFDQLRVLVADPFADAAEVTAAGATLTTLDAMLPVVDVLSLHAPALPSTYRMIGEDQLAMLRDGCTVINTARGALLDHDALLAQCRTGRLDAVLDVTDPEPLPPDSGLRLLHNVAITPHLAGSLGTETRRLTDSALDELEAYAAGARPLHPVRLTDMQTTA